MLSIEAVTIGYVRQIIVQQVSLSLPPGHIGCLLGPSGCGKTTLLRAIAGFEPVQSGHIAIAGDIVSQPGRTLPPEARQVGMVFQDLALFPHLSVADNIGFGLRRWQRETRDQRVAHLLDLVGLGGRGRHHPHELSGGQQQRVALARALAPRPRLLLMDEPFSSLDSALRETLAFEVQQILREEDITALMVTHDQFEAFAIADQIAVMDAGRIRQQGTGHDLYHQPADRFVADFVGQGSLLPGTMVEDSCVETPVGRVANYRQGSVGPGQEVWVLIRPDDLVLDLAGPFEGTVRQRVFRGPVYLYTLEVAGGHQVLLQAPSHQPHEVDSRVRLRLDVERLAVFPKAET